MGYSIFVAAILLTVGDPLVRLWTDGRVHVEPAMVALFAAYFPLGVWSHVHAMTLIGLGRVTITGAILLVEGFIVVGVTAIAIPYLGPSAVPIALVIGSLAVAAWSLPIATRRAFARDWDTGLA